MRFLVEPAFLTALAAWLCALGAHLGLDVPAEIVYGAASLVSVAVGGNAIRKRRAMVKKNGTSLLPILAIVVGSLFVVSGCKGPRINVGAVGSAYCAVQTDERFYKLEISGMVHAVGQRHGATFYVAAEGTGSVKISRLEVDTGEFHVYVDETISGKLGWFITVSSAGVITQPMLYEDAIKFTGVPGVPAPPKPLPEPEPTPAPEPEVDFQ